MRLSLSTSQAAAKLGVSARQVRRAAAGGRIVAAKAGAAHAFSQRQVQALERSAHRGRDWSAATQQAALDLLTTGKTLELTGPERSRLKQRIRSSDVGVLVGQVLRDRVFLRRAASDEAMLLATRIRDRLAIGELEASARTAVAGLIGDGLVDGTAAVRGTLQLTLRGRLLADAVARRLLEE